MYLHMVWSDPAVDCSYPASQNYMRQLYELLATLRQRKLVRQVLDIREKELGPDHVDVAASLNNIAVLLKTSGQFEEAEEMYNRSIAIKENALGPNHPQVYLATACKAATAHYKLRLPCATMSAMLWHRHSAHQKQIARTVSQGVYAARQFAYSSAWAADQSDCRTHVIEHACCINLHTHGPPSVA